MMLTLLTCAVSRPRASLTGRPRNVAPKACHGTKSTAGCSAAAAAAAQKSCSYAMVACSRPLLGSGGSSASFRTRVYLLAAMPCSVAVHARAMMRCRPTVGARDAQLEPVVARQVPVAPVARRPLAGEARAAQRLDVERAVEARGRRTAV